MDTRKIPKKNPEIVTRDIGGEVVLMPLYKSSDKGNYIYSFNKAAAACWNLIDGKASLDQIKNKLMKKFNVSEQRLEKQLDILIKDLKSIKAVTLK